MRDVNEDDKLWAALSWAIPIVAIVVLFIEDKRNRPFIKYHAVNSLAFAVAFGVAYTIITICTLGFGSVLGIVGFIAFYWAYLAYQGQWVEIPVVTNFVKNQGWV
jgi:uncharacterized membrane protein